MEVEIILLANGFFLSFLLFVMLLLLASQTSSPRKKRARIKEDLKKIKAQINDEDSED